MFLCVCVCWRVIVGSWVVIDAGHLSPNLIFRDRVSLELGSEPHGSCLSLSVPRIICTDHSESFHIRVGNQTQVLMLARKALNSLSHLPSLRRSY